MRSEKKQARHEVITKAAYELLALKGYEGTSMLSIAKMAKASNETLYRWYGDKLGLFSAMVEDNTGAIRSALVVALEGDVPPRQSLEKVAPLLLTMLLGDRAVLLNRVAASDPTGELGRTIAKGGREVVIPMIKQLMQKMGANDEIVTVYMSVLIGDQQIRRVIGALDVPTKAQIDARCAQAQNVLGLLLKGD